MHAWGMGGRGTSTANGYSWPRVVGKRWSAGVGVGCFSKGKRGRGKRVEEGSEATRVADDAMLTDHG